MNDQNHTVNLTKGEIKTLELKNLAGAGYSWQTVEYDASVCSVSITTGANDNGKAQLPPGASTPTIVLFEGISRGKTDVLLIQKRSWEPDDEATERHLVSVIVK